MAQSTSGSLTSGTSAQTFERFEYKYLAPRPRVDSALAGVGAVLREDEVALQAGASQINTSLYLDSPHFTFLEQHVSGSPDRIKLRVRYYGEQPRGDCFFEIKRRQNAVVMKERAVVPLEPTRALLADLTRAPPPDWAGNRTLQKFQYLALRCRAEPKLLVRARRKALRAADSGLDVRLTVDEEILWQPPRWPDALTVRPDRWRSLTPGPPGQARVLVEVKFRNAKPWWLSEITRSLAPWRLSFSKYVAAALEARQDPFFRIDAA